MVPDLVLDYGHYKLITRDTRPIAKHLVDLSGVDHFTEIDTNQGLLSLRIDFGSIESDQGVPGNTDEGVSEHKKGLAWGFKGYLLL